MCFIPTEDNQKAMETIDTEAVTRPDRLLRDRFVAGLADGNVQRIVRMGVRKRPEMDIR